MRKDRTDLYEDEPTPAQVKKLTPTQKRIREANTEGYIEGRRYELSLWQEKEKEQGRESKQMKLDQVKAVTELIKVTTDNLSKAGYLLSQLNKEKGW